MMHKRSIYSLLLTSFILVFGFALGYSQSVTVQSKAVSRCTPGSIDISVNPTADVSAFEIVLVATTTSGGAFYSASGLTIDPAVLLSMTTIVDLSGVNNTSPDTIRIAGMKTSPGNTCLSGPFPKKVATFSFTSGNVCSGSFTLAGANAVFCANQSAVSTQFVDCATNALVPATVTSGVVTIANQAPTLAAIANGTVAWGNLFTTSAVGSDNDLANGCEKLTYSKVSGPAALTVNPNTGAINWTPSGADVCVHTVTVQVADSCGATAQRSFDICVTNQPPVLTCPTDTTQIIWGEVADGDVNATDPDAGPSALLYSVASFNGPGGVGAITINPATGEWSWTTQEQNAYIGTFTLCIKASDGANTCVPCSPSNADTCCVTIKVIPTMLVTIEKTHNTIQGQTEEVSIWLDSTVVPGLEMGGYDLLVQYDASALNLLSAVPGQLLVDCGWEYFTYRFGANGNCGNGGCPTGVVRIVAIAETNNGANHPDCFGGQAGDSGELVKLTFLVSDNRTFECMYVPIRFIWYDCGDNAFSSVTGDTLYISRHVYDYDNVNPIEDLGHAFPSWYGANSTCDTALGDNKPDPLRVVDFQNGGIDIVCADSIDARGDINLNEISNEIADAVLFSNYFVYGLSVFHVNLQGQIAASDVNADGITLSVADLVYLIRVVIGDAHPFPKTVPAAIEATYSTGNGQVSIDATVAAAAIVVEGNVTPTLLISNVDMLYAFDGTNTRILVYTNVENRTSMGTFTGSFLSVSGNVISAEFATPEGGMVNAVGKALPTEFALKQNYPNPFNPKTTISFTTKAAVEYSLTIYNVTGQTVKTFSGRTAGAEVVTVDWIADGNASGVYFYKLQAGSFTDTKKMVFLK